MNITGGIYNRQKINVPPSIIARPTLSKIRMSVFNTLASFMDFENKSFLDMFSGSGIIALEALSRGFSDVVAVEKNKKAYDIIKSNFQKYEKDNNLKLYLSDSLILSRKLNKKFDVIYIDPPYYSGVYEQSLTAIKNICNNIVVLEHVVNVDITDGFEILKQKKYGEKYITYLEYINF